MKMFFQNKRIKNYKENNQTKYIKVLINEKRISLLRD